MARGRKKKVVEEPAITIPSRIQKIIKETEAKEESEFREVIEEVIKEKVHSEWDVRIGEKIDFFDSTLSYELTGYRPINETKGLDFKWEWFTEAREGFLRTGHYGGYKPGSKTYADFWTQEYIRCRDGLTVNGYTITGDYYFFLNYYQLMDLTSADKAGAGRVYAFPTFFVAQYEYFHYIELCKRLRKNAIGLKARGVG